MNKPTLLQRGLTQADAIAYLHLSKREFLGNWLPHLSVVPAGNRRLIDRHELDALFERRKTMPLERQQPSDRCDERVSRELNAVLAACRQQGRKRQAADRRDQTVPMREGGAIPCPR